MNDKPKIIWEEGDYRVVACGNNYTFETKATHKDSMGNHTIWVLTGPLKLGIGHVDIHSNHLLLGHTPIEKTISILQTIKENEDKLALQKTKGS